MTAENMIGSDNRRFVGKVALVTGGSDGIGRRAAERFAAEGMCVVIAARRAVRGSAVAASITAAGGDAAFMRTDISVAADVERLFGWIIEKYGRLDYAFNNAGVNVPGSIVDLEEADFDTVFAVNVKGLWLCMRHELRLMLTQGVGSIVNNLSVHSFRTVFPGVAAYASSKSAALALTRAAALENAAVGVRVNAVAPGPIATEMFRASKGAVSGASMWTSLIPTGRIGEPDEVVNAVLWLLSDASSFVAGEVLTVDGGFLSS